MDARDAKLRHTSTFAVACRLLSNPTMQPPMPCPYCGNPLRWIAPMGGLRGEFECAQCGEFPDYQSVVPALGTTLRARTPSRSESRAERPVVRHTAPTDPPAHN